ncbi:MAG: hypothetical protein JKP96_12515 [Oceanicaulis sp.]|nr:hypothetical protein [Oceanicaulis sp.]
MIKTLTPVAVALCALGSAQAQQVERPSSFEGASLSQMIAAYGDPVAGGPVGDGRVALTFEVLSLETPGAVSRMLREEPADQMRVALHLDETLEWTRVGPDTSIVRTASVMQAPRHSAGSRPASDGSRAAGGVTGAALMRTSGSTRARFIEVPCEVNAVVDAQGRVESVSTPYQPCESIWRR